MFESPNLGTPQENPVYDGVEKLYMEKSGVDSEEERLEFQAATKKQYVSLIELGMSPMEVIGEMVGRLYEDLDEIVPEELHKVINKNRPGNTEEALRRAREAIHNAQKNARETFDTSVELNQ